MLKFILQITTTILVLVIPGMVSMDALGSDTAFFSGENWSVGIETPLEYSFFNASDGSRLKTRGIPGGFLLYAQSPWRIGLGLEKYWINLDNQSPAEEEWDAINITMLDLFYTLPVSSSPDISLALGGGIGISEIKGDNADNLEPTTSSQIFFRMIFPMIDVCQVYLSFHRVFSQIKFKDNDTLLEAGGILTSVGMGVEF